MGLLLLILVQDLRTVVVEALRDRMTEARARVVADAVVAELGRSDVDRLLTHPVTRRSFDAMLRGFGADLPFRPIPEKSEVGRLWNDRVFELSLRRLPLRQAAAKLAAKPDEGPPRALARAIEKALEPSRDFLSDEALVARLNAIGGFRDAETLFAALTRVGEKTLTELPHRLDTPPWPEVEIADAVKHVQNYMVEGRLKAAVDRLHTLEAFHALVRDLYLATLPEPAVDPDPEQKRLNDALTAMRDDMTAIGREAYVPQAGSTFAVAFNAADFATRQVAGDSDGQSWRMDPAEVEWIGTNFNAVFRNDVTLSSVRGGVQITWVRPGSILALRGFQQHDVVVAVNDDSITGVADLFALRELVAPSVTIHINRAGQELHLTYSTPRR